MTYRQIAGRINEERHEGRQVRTRSSIENIVRKNKDKF